MIRQHAYQTAVRGKGTSMGGWLHIICGAGGGVDRTLLLTYRSANYTDKQGRSLLLDVAFRAELFAPSWTDLQATCKVAATRALLVSTY